MTETLADLMREIGLESAAGRVARGPPIPYRALTRKGLEQRPRGPSRQMENALRGQAPAPRVPRNQVRETGSMALEMTGLPSVRRSARDFASGDPVGGAANAGMAALALAPMFGGARAMRRTPAPPRPVRAFRGMRSPYQSGANNAATYEYWTDNPALASHYASGHFPDAIAPNVIPGEINTRNFLNVDAGGAPWDNIPIRGIRDRRIRGQFPNQDSGRGLTSRQVSQYAEDRGYDGVTFQNMRDAPASATDPNVAGPNTVFSVINRGARRGRFGRLDEAPSEPAARLPVNPSSPPGRTNQGGVLPVRPSEPFRNSLRGGSDNLREAAGMRGGVDDLDALQRQAQRMRDELTSIEAMILPYRPQPGVTLSHRQLIERADRLSRDIAQAEHGVDALRAQNGAPTRLDEAFDAARQDAADGRLPPGYMQLPRRGNLIEPTPPQGGFFSPRRRNR